MKEIKAKEKVAQDIMTPDNDFKGYTIEEIRFQRALVALEADFCKNKVFRSWNNLQKNNPFSMMSGGSKSSLPGKAGSIALKLINGLNYMDYVFLGVSAFSGIRKIYSLFKGKKK